MLPLVRIPNLMEDELLFSYIHRVAHLNALSVNRFYNHYISNRQTSEAKLNNIKIPKDCVIYIQKLALTLKKDPLDFYLKTSIYPGIAPLISAEKQGRVINI